MSDISSTPGDPPDETPYFGNDNINLTPWLIEFVRVTLAEHHSALYERLPPGCISIIVLTTLAGIDAANDNAPPA